MHQVFKKLLATRNLPTPSNIALKIMRLSGSKTASLDTIADLVEKDPALSGRILKYANTALFAAPLPEVSIRKAVVRLGTDTVMGLALGFSLLAKNRKGRCENFDFPAFWSTSLAMATAARGLAEIRTEFDPDELFICGLLSQIGRLALACIFPQEYSKLLEIKPNETELLVLETREFGINHPEVSLELFQEWGLPKRYIEAMASNEKPPSAIIAEGCDTSLSQLLQLARLMAMICMMESPLSEQIAEAEELARKNSLSGAEFTALFDKIISNWQEWSLLFQIPVQDCSSYVTIKSIGEDQKPVIEEGKDSFRILVVDDDILSLRALELLLANSTDTILCAENGDEALRIAIQYQPDLVITDWQMPGMNGIELCRTLRKTEFAKHLYIIMLTANEKDDELIQAFDAGADDYVVKPFNPKVLKARIHGGKRLVEYQEMMNRDQAIIRDYTHKLATINKKLHTMAMTDALTGLPNRRSAMERLQEMQSECKRFGSTLSCIMIDIDNFKKINDTYGHESGDLVLKKISDLFIMKSRGYDIVSRIGGEEFLIVSNHNTLHEATVFAERLRKEVADQQIAVRGQTLQITISLGVAAVSPEMPEIESLLHLADKALYNAKRGGRNRVEVAT
jgi:diguanylate cyclase (GGDEF)-like protein